MAIDTPEKLKKWLLTQSREMAQALTLRIALRVFPNVWDENTPSVRFNLMFAIIRALVISRAGINFPALNMTDAARAAFSFHAKAYYAAHTNHARPIDPAEAPFAYPEDPALFSPLAAEFARVYATSEEAIEAYASDAEWVDFYYGATKNEPTAQLMLNRPLWPRGLSKPINQKWRAMKAGILRHGGEWDIWIEWYENRMSGQEFDFSLLPIAGHNAIAQIAMEENAFWERSPAEVNADIKARLLAAVAHPPALPAQGSGPHFTLEDGKALFVRPEDLDPAKNNIVRLKSLQPLVQKLCAQGIEVFGRNAQHAFVLTYLQMYAEAVSGPAETLDYEYLAGLGLILAQAETAARREIDDRLKSEFEDDEKTILSGLLDLHGPFILASEAGQTLLADAELYQRDRDQEQIYRDDGVGLIEAGADAGLLGDSEAAFSKATIAIAAKGSAPERSAIYAGAMVKNATIVFIGGGVVASVASMAAESFSVGAHIGGSLTTCLALILGKGMEKSEPFQSTIQSVASLFNRSPYIKA